jgi:signal transduction histidine kinase
VSDSDTFLSSQQGSSQRQIRILLWIGFGGLLLLLSALGLSAISFLYQIEIRQEKIRQDYVDRDRTLEKLRANIYLSGTYVRDFLLDKDEASAEEHKTRFLDTERQIQTGITEYQHLVRTSEREVFEQLQKELNHYFSALTSALAWSPQQRQQQGYTFVQNVVLPRRMNAIGFADRIQQLSEKELEQSSETVSDLFASFRFKLLLLLVLAVAIGIALTAATLYRLLALEREAAERFGEVLKAREELQRLSAELLSAQENERRRLSRELHDEVGQVLSAMGLALENVRHSIAGDNRNALQQLAGAQEMAAKSVSVIRNISLLLRPAMLDDLGLLPALKWLAREVSRTHNIQVDVATGEFPDELPEEHRTCVYRVVQEALRNATRHSSARQVRIYVAEEEGRLRVSVQDDGKGFNPSEEKGLGMLGMEERVARLGGLFSVNSHRGQGTTVSLELPLPHVLPRMESVLERL